MKSGSPSHAAIRVIEGRGFGAERQALEATLDQHGLSLPVLHSAEWLRADGNEDAVLHVAHDADGKPVAAAVVAIARTRALPGHVLHQVTRFMSSRNDEVDRALLSAIVEGARRDSRCLRLTVRLFEPDAASRARLGAILAGFGFNRNAVPRSYRVTLIMDVTPGEEALLAALKGKVRRDVREPTKKGLELRPVDARYTARLEQLMAETYSRTGGSAPPYPWAEMVDLATRYPNRARIAGLFDPKTPGPESLLGFAFGFMQGECAAYDAGASTRREDLGRIPLAYAPLWDLIAWASRTPPAKYFDFGGYTIPEEGVNDPLAGISRFKQFFTENAVEVGEDWTFEPRALRGAIARVVSAVAKKVAAGR